MVALAATMWEREADDSFGGTRIGKAYEKVKSTVGRGLENSLRAGPDASTHQLAEFSIDDFQVLQNLVKEFQFYMHQAAENIDEIVHRIVSDVSAPEGISTKVIEEKLELLRHLEEPLRVAALLETDHKLQNRVGS